MFLSPVGIDPLVLTWLPVSSMTVWPAFVVVPLRPI
jgi:hypothetical protein